MNGFDRLKGQLVDAVKSRVAGDRHPRLPEAGTLFWNAFCDLCATRTYHASGPNPIAYAEIEAWTRVRRRPLEPRHVELILAMDQAWIEASASARKRGGKAIEPVGGPLTPDFFDAVF